MEEVIKLDKKYKIYYIIIGTLTAILAICGICVEVFSNLEGDLSLYLFLGFFLGLVFCLICIFILAWKSKKLSDKIYEVICKEIPLGYTYQTFEQDNEWIKESNFPCKKDSALNAYESIEGMLDTIPFTYSLCTIYQDSLWHDMKAKRYEVYIFKNICSMQKDFIATTIKSKKLDKLDVSVSTEQYTIYSKEKLEDIRQYPNGVDFMSLQHNVLYVFKKAKRKKAFYSDARTKEELQQKFSFILEDIKNTYEEVSPWLTLK